MCAVIVNVILLVDVYVFRGKGLVPRH